MLLLFYHVFFDVLILLLKVLIILAADQFHLIKNSSKHLSEFETILGNDYFVLIELRVESFPLSLLLWTNDNSTHRGIICIHRTQRS